MAKASNNQFPSVLLTEQGSAPEGPAAGDQRIFIDSADHHLKRVDENDNVTDLEEAGAGGAPTDATYIVGAANGSLSAEVVKAYMADNYDPDAYPAVPNALDDEFEGGGSLDVKWTKVNDPAGADALNQTDFAGFLHVGLAELGTDNFDNLVRLYQTPPAGTAVMSFIAKVAVTLQGMANEAGEWCSAALYLGNSAQDQFVAASCEINDAAGVMWGGIATASMDNGSGAVGAMTTTQTQRFIASEWVYLKLEKATADAYTSANTYNAYFSRNGITWWHLGTASKAFTTACDEVGIYFRRPKSQTGTPKGYALVDFFRRVA